MLPLAVLMQRRAVWMLGVADLTLDQCEKDKNFDLDSLLPGICLPEEATTNEVDIEDANVHEQCLLCVRKIRLK